MAIVTPVVLKYKTTDIGLNKTLQAYRDKINKMIEDIPWTTKRVEYVRLQDTNDTHYLEMAWDEDDIANRTLKLYVHGGNRTIDLTGNLVVESTSYINSDLSTDANWATSGTLECGALTVDSQSIIIKGTSTGDANRAWIGFYDSNGITRRGFVGDSSVNNDDIVLRAETGDLKLLAAGNVASTGTFSAEGRDLVRLAFMYMGE